LSTDVARGKKLFELSAVPAKEILRNKASVCPPISAICEIFDNVFDNFDENGASSDLSISVVVRQQGTPPSISIAENSGGIPRDRLEPLVRLGVPSHSIKGAIGTWGEGFKVAAFALGSDVDVRTYHPGDQPISVHFAHGWLDSKEWSVPVYELSGDTIRQRSTEFVIRYLKRGIDWSEIMRDIAVIYGHKIRGYEQNGRRIRLEFDIDGQRALVKPRPLASVDALRNRYSFPPEFSPRIFNVDMDGEYGSVSIKFLVGLTARHSGETSGIYLYGNGRLFARALRSRAVGYGESGNSILRDHPSCWRIHCYVFIQAEDGRDVPWQAPLKDGISENHYLTPRIRHTLKEILSPYSRFAKVAKAAELVPYTMEWSEMPIEDRAETLFGKDCADGLERFRALPKAIKDFEPPVELESIKYDGVACERLLHDLEKHAKYSAALIRKRDEIGPSIEEDLLRALNPRAFPDNGTRPTDPRLSKSKIKSPLTRKLVLELRTSYLDRLKRLFHTDDDREAVIHAVRRVAKASRRKGRTAARESK